MVTFFNVFDVFLKIQKNMTFYVFEMLHTFSRTLGYSCVWRAGLKTYRTRSSLGAPLGLTKVSPSQQRRDYSRSQPPSPKTTTHSVQPRRDDSYSFTQSIIVRSVQSFLSPILSLLPVTPAARLGVYVRHEQPWTGALLCNAVCHLAACRTHVRMARTKLI